MKLLSHQQSKTRELHSQLAFRIEEIGKRHDKKHGGWYILHVTPNLWFEMDSWNRSINLQCGAPETDEEKIYWIGFGGTRVCRVGIDFGGYESELNEKQYLELIELASQKP